MSSHLLSAAGAGRANDIIFVQIPAGEAPSAEYPLPAMERYAGGSRIVLLTSRSSAAVNLTPEFYAACDPDVSFDGKSIIFAGKKNAEQRWQIWEMHIDGSAQRQITHSEGDCITPLYAGDRFYLDDPQPTPQIIYAATTHGWQNELEGGPVYSLYGTDAEGTTTHRLTFNCYNDYSPDILSTGQIVFTSCQPNRNEYRPNDFRPDAAYALMAVNNDGTDVVPFYGVHEPPVFKDMLHVSPGDEWAYFIESDRESPLGGGDIARLSQRRPLRSHHKVSTLHKGAFLTPCPLADGELLASYRENSPGAVYSIYRIDATNGKRIRLIYGEPGWHSIDVQLSTARPTAKGRSNWLIPGTTHGVYYCLDCYRTDLSDLPAIETGSIKYIRVIEGVPQKWTGPDERLSTGVRWDSNSPPSPASLHALRRIIGVAPVEKDGSFHIRIPAGTPVNFQLLDENSLPVRAQKTWTWVMGNENRGCIGCHEDRELSPPNIMPSAVTKAAMDLTQGRRTVDFRREIATLIASRCATAGCHGNGGSGPDFSVDRNPASETTSRRTYDTLLGPPDGVPYVIPGEARGSPLVWHLFGKRLVPGRAMYRDDIPLMPPGAPLESGERLLFIEWIDLNAQWDCRGEVAVDAHGFSGGRDER